MRRESLLAICCWRLFSFGFSAVARHTGWYVYFRQGGCTVRKSAVFSSLLALGLLMNGLSIRGETRFPENGPKQSQGMKDQIFVAHQDDDLLFMNPDLMTRIRNGVRVQTVYVTAGDKDKGPDYWMSREAGVKEAYAYMAEVPNVWRQSTVEVENKRIVKFTLKAAPRIDLIFLRLPDGIDDRKGEVTLKTIWSDRKAVACTKDMANSYTREELTLVIRRLIADYCPDTVQYIYPGNHVDHRTVAKFVRLADGRDRDRHAVIEYRDYDINKFPPNLVNDKSDAKWKVARIYGAHDRYFPKFIIEKKYQVYYNWCKREYHFNSNGLGKR
jgi:LmbE family N-acetylglucosaminyl deacetylase